MQISRPIPSFLLAGAIVSLPIVASPASDPDSLAVEAQRVIEQGHLQQAIQLLEQALEIDPEHARVRELREFVKQRYFERAGLLFDATELATVGKFSAADRKMAEAERIDSDDTGSLMMARDLITEQQTEYYVHNPPHSIFFQIGLGSLGVDEDYTESRVDPINPVDIGGSTPLDVALGWAHDLRRHVLVDLRGGYGFSRNDDSASFEKDLVQFWQLTAGIGLRTIRTARKKYEFQVAAGLGWETAKTDLTGNSGLDSSDSQLGAFVRAGVEIKKVGLFLQRGVGFDQDPSPDSAIGWSDRTQFGIAYSF